MQITIRLAVALLLVASAAAQTSAAPPPPHVLIDTVGPDGWRVRLGPTNLGSLLASEAGRELWQPEIDPYLGAWRHVSGDDTTFAAARDLAVGYGGHIRIGIWLDERGDADRIAAVLEGDGRTDLQALAAEVRRLQERARGEWTKAEVDGETIELRTNGGEVMTAPLLRGQAIVFAMARQDGIAEALGAARSLAHEATGKAPPPTSPALRIQADVPRLVAGAELSPAMTTAIGLDSLGSTTLTIGTAGPHVQVELSQSFTSAERGVFGALFPAMQGVPSLLRLHGAKGAWKVGRFDWLALWRAIERIFATEEIGQANVREDVRGELGCDIVDDLLAHVTDEVLIDVAPLDDPERVSRTPWTLAVRLGDQARFKAGLDAALAKANPLLTRKDSVEHADCELRRYGNMFGYDLWFAVGRDLFAVAGGADAEDRLKSMLDAAKETTGAAQPADPTRLAELDGVQRHLPPGCNGLARGEIDSIVAVPMGLWLLGAGELMRGAAGVDDDPDVRERWLALVREHHLDTVRTASGYADAQWRWRLFW